MANKTWFSSLSDATKKTKVIPGTGDWYIQEIIYDGTGVYANSTSGVSTLTPATSPTWADDQFNSTVAKNLLIVDANGVVCAAKVTDTVATAVTFDETAALLESDGTTPGTFVPGATYAFKVLTPCSAAGLIYGPYFGYAEAVDIAITDELMELYSGFPESLQFSDLKRRTGKISGGHINVVNKDVAMTIMGAVEYGLNSGNNSAYAIGSSPIRGVYRIAVKMVDRNVQTDWLIVRNVQFSANGNIIGNAASGHKMFNFNGNVQVDSFYPIGADMAFSQRLA